MRIASFLTDGRERLGIEVEDRLLDVNLACQEMLLQPGEGTGQRLADVLLPADAASFLAGGADYLEQARNVIAFAGAASAAARSRFLFNPSAVKRLAPVAHPGKIVCVGRNYRDHVAEMKSDLPSIPVIFAKLPNTVCADGDEIPFPRVSQQLDYEAELAVVIGKRGRYITAEDALDHVAGYTALNDVSVRDWQHRTPQWLQGKSFDRSAPIGPVLVTADEIPDPHTLAVKSRLNGDLRQNDTTAHLIFNIPFLISFISQVMTLEPGDIIATGTPAGVGAAMKPQGFMKVGDTVQVEIERIGLLTNRIVAG